MSGCEVNKAEIGQNEATGTGSTAVNSNHIIQYPKQPKRDDGKWLAIASLLGAVLGRVAAQGLINKAKAAENAWKDINEKIRDTGHDLIGKAEPEWSLAKEADGWLLNEALDNQVRATNQEAYGASLEACNDTIHNQLCEFIKCGYQEDHLGIALRIKADAEASAKQKRRELHRTINRYSVNQCCEIDTRIALATSAEIVGNTAKAREAERQTAWQTNYKLRFEGAELFEKHRDARIRLGQEYAKMSIAMQETRYGRHAENYRNLMMLGLDALASAGKNYAWLADSYRKTAEKDMGAFGAIAAMVILAIGAFKCWPWEKECDKSGCCSG